MNQAKRMRLVGDENPEMESDESDTTQNDWSNLPYPVIHNIAKVLGFTIPTGNRLRLRLVFSTTLLIRKSCKALGR